MLFGKDIFGNPTGKDVFGTPANQNIQGETPKDGFGNTPKDIYGNATGSETAEEDKAE